MIFSVTKTARYWYGISAILILTSLMAIGFWGIKPGIDFIGGSVIEIKSESINVPAVRESLKDFGDTIAEVQSAGEKGILIRARELSADEHGKILAKLKGDFKNTEELRFDSIGPVFSRDLLIKSVMAIVLASAGILLYLSYVFRKSGSVVSSWAFGTIAVLALIHDALVITGFFAVYAHFYNASADSLFVTAILTVIGFSVHDTIVIFNRVKTNLRVYRLPFPELVDKSVLETFSRSINTSMTTLFVLLALLFFGGSTIRPFVATLSAGIIVGSYSSIFVAAPVLSWWQGRNKGKKPPAGK